MRDSHQYTNNLEVRVCGLMRSGNHAIIDWIMKQHEGRPCCFLNNVKHGNHDPFQCHKQMVTSATLDGLTIEDIRRTNKQLLLYSYEDRVDRDRLNLVDSVFDNDFQSNKTAFLGTSRREINVLVLRDPFNCIASRLQLLRTRGALGGDENVETITNNWISLAEHAVALGENPASDNLVIKFNRWATDQAYRQTLSRTLEGVFNDASLDDVTRFGGGSSFDPKALRFSDIASGWRKLFLPSHWRRLRYHLSRLCAPKADKMRVQERWMPFATHGVFREAFLNPRVLELSEELFGELAGTRQFVRSLRSNP